MTFKDFQKMGTMIFLLSLSLGFSGWVWGMAYQDVTILSMDEDGLTLEINLPSFRMKNVEGPDGPAQRICLRDWAKTGKAGYPELPYQALLIQVPESGELNVHILGNVVKTVPECRIYPVPRLLLSDEGDRSTEFVEMGPAPRCSPFYPGVAAEIDSRCILRGVHVARLKIYPFQWNWETHELRYSTKIHVNVAFENPLKQIPTSRPAARHLGIKDLFETLMEQTIINYRHTGTSYRHASDVNPSQSQPHVASGDDLESLRIEVTEDGIYRLTYEALVTAGINPESFDPETFRLFHLGSEIAIQVVYGKYGFGPGDYVSFYGRGMDNQFTGTNVYRFYWHSTMPGLRMDSIDGTVTGTGAKQESFLETLHVEENHTFWAAMPGAPEVDYWFWKKMTAPTTLTYAMNIPSPDLNQTDALVRVYSQGRSTPSPHPNHHSLIYLNDTLIGDHYWDGDIDDLFEMSISTDLLLDGDNMIKIKLPGDTGAVIDIVYHNWTEIEYWRYFEAEQNQLRFTVESDERIQVEIENLDDALISIYDITDANNVKRIINYSIQWDKLNFHVLFEDQPAGTKTYYVLTAGWIKEPDRIIYWEPGSLAHPTNAADMIIVTAEEFLPALEPLCLHHRNRKLRVRSVSVESIYNEFNHGLFHPAAIKDFLTYAYENWEPPSPTYVLLVGDSNIDYRDYYGTGKENKAPVHLGHTQALGLTPNDNWYVCVEGEDALPEMFLGRIPGDSSEVVSATIDKLLRHEQSFWTKPHKALFVADDNSLSFENLSESLIALLPPEFDFERIYLRLYGDDHVDEATQDIISNINEGMMITNYVGHGAVTNWSGEFLFQSSDIPSLTNENHLTFVLAMNCLNGYFAQPFYYSLAEEFVIAQNGGAFGNFSPSSLTYLWEHEYLNKAIFSILFEQGDNILGSLTTQSKIAAYAQGASEELLNTFILFGDPAGRLINMVPGDVDGNGLVNARDLLIIKNVLCDVLIEGVEPCTQPVAGDFNANGILDAFDLTIVANRLVHGEM